MFLIPQLSSFISEPPFITEPQGLQDWGKPSGVTRASSLLSSFQALGRLPRGGRWFELQEWRNWFVRAPSVENHGKCTDFQRWVKALPPPLTHHLWPSPLWLQVMPWHSLKAKVTELVDLNTSPTWAVCARPLPCLPGWAAKGPSLPRCLPPNALLSACFQWALPEVLWTRRPWHWSASPAAWSASCAPLTSAARSWSESPCTSQSTSSLMVSPPLRIPFLLPHPGRKASGWARKVQTSQGALWPITISEKKNEPR